MTGINSRIGDGIGNLWIIFGIVLLLAGVILTRQSHNSVIIAFNEKSRRMSQYMLGIGIVISIFGFILTSSGFIHLEHWLSDYYQNNRIYQVYYDWGEPAQIFGQTLEFSWEQYENAFEKGGYMSYALAIGVLIGIYIALGSSVALLRKDSSVVKPRTHVLGIFYGIGLTVGILVILFLWVNHVARLLF